MLHEYDEQTLASLFDVSTVISPPSSPLYAISGGISKLLRNCPH